MTDLQRRTLALQAKLTEARAKKDTLVFDDAADSATLEAAVKEVRSLERRYGEAEKMLAVEQTADSVVVVDDGEGREVRSLEGRAKVSSYLSAAADGAALDGPESELNAALKIGRTAFPLRLLAPREVRASTAVEAATTQATWLDRIFGETAAMHIGVDFQSVPSGVSAHPVTTAGASGAQRGKGQDAGAAAWTVGVTEMKPKRGAVRATFDTVDAARLMGLEDALSRDLRMAMADHMDKTILKGDATANPADGDIVGLQTAGITEASLSQTNKVLGAGVTTALASFIDGLHASTPADVKIAASVGSSRLWLSNLVQAGGSVDSSLAQYLRANGFSWITREGIDTATSAGDFAAYIGLGRQQAGAGVAAVWEAGQLIRDPYSDAAGGTVALTLSYLWDFALPRTSSFGRIKYVAG